MLILSGFASSTACLLKMRSYFAAFPRFCFWCRISMRSPCASLHVPRKILLYMPHDTSESEKVFHNCFRGRGSSRPALAIWSNMHQQRCKGNERKIHPEGVAILPKQRRCADDSACENVLYAHEPERASRELDETLQVFRQRAAASGWDTISFPYNFYVLIFLSFWLPVRNAHSS